jgi:hypothetical protein
VPGSTGSICTLTERSPRDGAIAFGSSRRFAWPSLVEMAVTAVPFGPSSTLPVAPLGGLLVLAASGGGLTQR